MPTEAGSSPSRMRLMYLGPPETLADVQAFLPEFEVRLALNEPEVGGEISRCDVILDAYMKVRFSAELLAGSPRLKLFVAATTGADHVDHEELSRRGIELVTIRGKGKLLKELTPAAEHSWLLLMACARKLRGAMEEVLGGGWDRNLYPGVMLRGSTLGIIGCGRIGTWMSRYGRVFGMHCLGYDPFVEPWPKGIESSNLDHLLSNSDFVSVHIPSTDDTRGFLGPEEFKKIKRGAVLVNTSRGDVIDEISLLEALQVGRLAAAGLDVLSGEPHIANHQLVEYARRHSNLIVTPHIGGFSPTALKLVLQFCCDRILQFADSREWTRG